MIRKYTYILKILTSDFRMSNSKQYDYILIAVYMYTKMSFPGESIAQDNLRLLLSGAASTSTI